MCTTGKYREYLREYATNLKQNAKKYFQIITTYSILQLFIFADLFYDLKTGIE